MFKPLGSLLPDALSRLKVRKPVEAGLVCRAADEVLGTCWDHAVPMRAIRFSAGTLTVAVVSSAWAHEIRMQSEHIRDAINKKLGGAHIKALRSRVAPAVARGEEPT